VLLDGALRKHLEEDIQMAKKKGGPNKSLEIRTYLEANPGAKPRQVVDAMKSKGIEVSPQFVSTVKTNSQKSSGSKGRSRRTASKKGATKTAVARRTVATKTNGDTVSVASLVKLKEVVKEIGSIDEAKAALKTLERLAD
jgi:hypothetical protein